MSYLISSDFLLVKKIKVLKVFNAKFINEKRNDNYEFFNILQISIRIFKGIFTKDSYDKIIDYAHDCSKY
jgi:hypothetical protein